MLRVEVKASLEAGDLAVEDGATVADMQRNFAVFILFFVVFDHFMFSKKLRQLSRPLKRIIQKCGTYKSKVCFVR